MALYSVILRQRYVSQKCINRFSYTSTVEPVGVNGSTQLAEFLGAGSETGGDFTSGTVLGEIQRLQDSQVTFEELEVMNLYDDNDFYVYPFIGGTSGSYAGAAPASPLLAYGFRSNRVTRAIRRGTHRFVGVDEALMAGGGLIESAGLTLMGNVATAMSAVLNPTNTDSKGTYVPSVFQFKEYTTAKGNKAYKKWPTEAEQLAHNAVGVTWEYYADIRSQVSRQYGRGQ